MRNRRGMAPPAAPSTSSIDRGAENDRRRDGVAGQQTSRVLVTSRPQRSRVVVLTLRH